MITQIQDDLKTLCGIIHETVNPDKIYLFGSYAYGTPTKDSDYDLCVVMPDDSARPIETAKLIRRAIYPKQTCPLDLLVYHAGMFAEKSRYATLERKIAREGVLLYERG